MGMRPRKTKDGTGRVLLVTTTGPGTSGTEISPKVVGSRADWDAARRIDPYYLPPFPTPIKDWRPVGSPPLSDAEAMARVVSKPEVRPMNQLPLNGVTVPPNAYMPTATDLERFHASRNKHGQSFEQYNPRTRFLTGHFTGTTDEIIQWAAHKWGIPEDWIRAVCVTESSWNQWGLGDRQDGVDAARHPAYARIDSDSAWSSLGITQVKYTVTEFPVGSGPEPLRWRSTAFNLDWYGCSIRYYFDGGAEAWGFGGSGEPMEKYSAGQEWGSIGGHYSPWPWGSAVDYMYTVQRHLNERTWESF